MRKDTSLIAALAAVLGWGMSPEKMFMATKTFVPDEKTEAGFKKALEVLNSVPPGDVDSFFITVLHRTPPGTKCEGCGEVHDDVDSLFHYAAVDGDDTALMAQIMEVVNKAEIGRK